MTGPTSKKSKTSHVSRIKTKRRTKDLDQIDEDMKDGNAHKLLHQEIDLDKPGDAQHYCLHCARYFITQEALKAHFKSKVHKRRLKNLRTEPYTIEESKRAGGLGSYIPPKKRKVETQPMDDGTFDPSKEDVDMNVDKN